MTGPIILLAGGGTGGHVIPAIATAEEIVRQGGRVRFVGTRDRLEAVLVPKAGFEIDFIDVRPLAGGSIKTKISGGLSLPQALLRSIQLLHKRHPDVVMGVGGYVAGPVVFAASLMGIPTALLEQNAAVGMTNRLLARWVKRAFVTYEETLSDFPQGRGIWTGNPVKSSILHAAAQPKTTAGRVRILVMGGSQGARSLDLRVTEAITAAKVQDGVQVLHQCSKGNMAAVADAYRRAGIEAEVVPFIDDTAAAFRNTDFVVARSGATTVAELTVMGLPAIFLPYPHHKDRQQERNALPMQKAGAAMILDEKTTTIEALADGISKFVNDAQFRARAATASAVLGRRDAAQKIAESLFCLAGGCGCSDS